MSSKIQTQEPQKEKNHNSKEVRDYNLRSQVKRILKRTSQEMVCISIILSMGYSVQFRKPKISKKSKPFLLIEKIFKGNILIFDIKEEETFYQNEKKRLRENSNEKTNLNLKEILTSIVMKAVIDIMKKNERLKIKTKCSSVNQRTPKFLWIESISIDNILYLKETLYKIGKPMLEIIDHVKNNPETELKYDYKKFKSTFDSKYDERLFDFLGLLEMFYTVKSQQMKYPLNNPICMKRDSVPFERIDKHDDLYSETATEDLFFKKII